MNVTYSLYYPERTVSSLSCLLVIFYESMFGLRLFMKVFYESMFVLHLLPKYLIIHKFAAPL